MGINMQSMNTQHTPGPWEIAEWGRFIDVGPGPVMVATLELERHFEGLKLPSSLDGKVYG